MISKGLGYEDALLEIIKSLTITNKDVDDLL